MKQVFEVELKRYLLASRLFIVVAETPVIALAKAMD